MDGNFLNCVCLVRSDVIFFNWLLFLFCFKILVKFVEDFSKGCLGKFDFIMFGKISELLECLLFVMFR